MMNKNLKNFYLNRATDIKNLAAYWEQIIMFFNELTEILYDYFRMPLYISLIDELL